jgi:NAD(P)H-nitrite reductase large subunit
LDIAAAGIVNPVDKSCEILSRRNGNTYRKVVLKDGLVVGMVFASNIEKSGIVYSLMKDEVNVNEFKQALIADDFSLVSLPEEIWRLRLQPSGVVSRVTLPPEPEEAAVGD